MIERDSAARIISNLRSLLPSSSRMALSKRFLSTDGMLVLPELRSDDPLYATLVKNINDWFLMKGLTDIDDDGVYIGPPVTSSHSGNLTMPGTIRHPLNFGKTLSSYEPDELFRDVAERVIKLAFGSHSGRPGKIVRYSNSGFPFFTNDLMKKKEHLRFVAANSKLFKELLMTENYRSLYDKLRIMNLSFIQLRLQSDVWKDGHPKIRDVHAFEDVYYKEGDPTRVSKVNYFTSNGLATCRTRVVYALPTIINNYMSCIFEGYKDSFFKEFELTFKHRGGDHITNKLSKFSSYIGVDVKNFDSSVPSSILNLLVNLMPISEFERKIIIDLLNCNIYCSDIDGRGTAGITGDPFKKCDIWKGMPSGVFFTTFINNIIMLTIYLYIFVKNGFLNKNVLSDIAGFLNHKYDLALLLAGDDGIVCSNDRGLVDELKDGGLDNDVLSIEKEDGLKFLGNLIYKDGGNLCFCNDIASYVKHTYCPEKGAYSFYRKYPVYGLKLKRDEVFINHPYFGEFKEHEERCWKDILGIDINEMIRNNLMKEMNLMHSENIHLSINNPIDRDVLLDNSKIHYKYSEDEVSAEVLDIISQRADQGIMDKITSFILEERNVHV